MKIKLYMGVVVFVLIVGVVYVGGYLVFVLGEGDFSWDSYNVWVDVVFDLSGQIVIILGFWLQLEDDVFCSVIVYFVEVIGVEVIYIGLDSFEQQIVIDVEVGLVLNVVVFLQLGLVVDFVGCGLLYLLFVGMGDWVINNYGVGLLWVDLGIYVDGNGVD